MSNYENFSGVAPIAASFPPDQYFYAAYNSYNPNYLIAQQQAALQAQQLAANQQLAAVQQAGITSQPQTVQSTDESAISFQGAPQEKSSSATPWVVGGLTIAAGALALYAKHKGSGNILEGLKTIWQNIKGSKATTTIVEEGTKAIETVANKGAQAAQTVSTQGNGIVNKAKEFANATKKWFLGAKPTETLNVLGYEVGAISTSGKGYTVFLK